MCLFGPVLDILLPLSTKYSKIARVSLDLDQPSASGDDNSQILPNGEIVVIVADDDRDAAVGVELQVFQSFVFLLGEIKEHRSVR